MTSTVQKHYMCVTYGCQILIGPGPVHKVGNMVWYVGVGFVNGSE